MGASNTGHKSKCKSRHRPTWRPAFSQLSIVRNAHATPSLLPLMSRFVVVTGMGNMQAGMVGNHLSGVGSACAVSNSWSSCVRGMHEVTNKGQWGNGEGQALMVHTNGCILARTCYHCSRCASLHTPLLAVVLEATLFLYRLLHLLHRHRPRVRLLGQFKLLKCCSPR